MVSIEYGCLLARRFWEHRVLDAPLIAVEAGVYHGHSIGRMVKALPEGFPIYGFDSFEGIPEDWVGTPHKAGLFSRGGQVPDVPGATLIKGWFEHTIPPFAATLAPGTIIGLLHVDCDLYSSTKTVLDHLNAYLVPGTIIVCDDWIYNEDPNCNDQEQRAFWEWVTTYNRAVAQACWVDQTEDGKQRATFVVTS